MSTLFAYIKESGFNPPDEALFERLSSSLSMSLVDQAKSALSISAFCNLTRRNHFMKFASPTVTSGQKARLMGSDPFNSDLFDQSTLSDVVSAFDSASATTSHINVSKAVTKGLFFSGKRKRDESPQSNSSAPGGSSAPPATPAIQPDVASLFKTPIRGKGDRGKGSRGGGRGGQRSKGGSNVQKPGHQGFAQ